MANYKDMKKGKKKKSFMVLYGFSLGVSFAFGFQLPFLAWYLWSYCLG